MNGRESVNGYTSFSPGVTQCHCSYFEWYYTRAIHQLIASVFSRIS